MGRGRIPPAELAGWTRQLATLLKAGLPPFRALTLLAEETTVPVLEEALREVTVRVRRGESLSAALAASGRFPSVLVSIVNAGELSGTVDVVLAKYADYLERQVETTQRLQSMLVYPVLLLSIGLLSVFFLMIVVIPRFVGLFQEFGQQLPWLTRVLLAASMWLRTHAELAALSAAALVLGGRAALASREGAAWWLRVKYRLPLLGALLLKVDLSRFCLILGTLVGAGVPVLEALGAARDTLNNRWLAEEVDRMVAAVRRGVPLSEAMKEGGRFPSIMTQLLVVGEETGKPEELLLHLHGYYDRAVDRGAKMLLSLVEPVLVVALGVLVGIMVMAVLLPILTLSTSIRG